MVIKKCQYCGKEFKTSHANKIYCSRGCYSLARIKPRYCKICGKQIALGSSNSKYCSRECYLKEEKIKKICNFCKKPYIGSNITFCSKECQLAWHRAKREAEGRVKNPNYGRERPCLYCGELFKGVPSRKYCSCECAAAAKSKNIKKICLACGEEFTINKETSWQNPKFCSPECQVLYNKTKNKDQLKTLFQSEAKRGKKDMPNEISYPAPIPKRLCHDCKKVHTANYRCDACLRKWHKKNNVMVTDNYDPE